MRRSELRQLELEPDALDEVLARYGEHRLLTFDREPLTRTPTVEVAHEAILSQWDRLRGWIGERREHLLLHRRLVEAVAEWEDAGRDPEYLPREGRLAQFEAWAGATDLALTAGERAFLAEARAAANAAGPAAGAEAAGDAGRVRAACGRGLGARSVRARPRDRGARRCSPGDGAPACCVGAGEPRRRSRAEHPARDRSRRNDAAT